MEKSQKSTLLLLIIIGVLFFCLMIPANLTGAETSEMLAIFEVDEYAQYEHVLRMLTPGDTFYQSIRNFTVYLHYFYGYPFYFVSALFLFPLKLILGSGWIAETRLIVCWLRQTVSVLPMILAAGIFVWLGTRFKKKLLSAGLFIFLLTIPAVILNHFWWHPDSLAVLLVALVFFFLDRDTLRFGKSFYAAAGCCGIALSVKYAGVYFAAVIPFYLLLGQLRTRPGLKKTLRRATLFVLVMILFLVISNPLLLLPQERAEIIQTQALQFEQTGTGIFVRQQNPFFENGNLPADVRLNYAETWFFILAFGGLLIGLRQGKREQTRSLLTLVYLVTASAVVLLAASRRLHYYLLIALPLFSFLPDLFAGENQPAKHRKLQQGLFVFLILLQWVPNMLQSGHLYQVQLNREKESPAIQLYETLQNEILPEIAVPAERMYRVFRDWKIYFPEQEGVAIQMDWDMPTMAKISEWQPDLILLEQENLRMFGDADILRDAVDADALRPVHEFYAQAQQDQIPGYEKILEDQFGVVFKKEELRSGE